MFNFVVFFSPVRLRSGKVCSVTWLTWQRFFFFQKRKMVLKRTSSYCNVFDYAQLFRTEATVEFSFWTIISTPPDSRSYRCSTYVPTLDETCRYVSGSRRNDCTGDKNSVVASILSRRTTSLVFWRCTTTQTASITSVSFWIVYARNVYLISCFVKRVYSRL